MIWPVNQACLHCSQCTLAMTGNLCPIRYCPKGMLNGPCGGATEDHCEVVPDAPCVWHSIFRRLAIVGTSERFALLPRKDFSQVRQRKKDNRSRMPQFKLEGSSG